MNTYVVRTLQNLLGNYPKRREILKGLFITNKTSNKDSLFKKNSTEYWQKLKTEKLLASTKYPPELRKTRKFEDLMVRVFTNGPGDLGSIPGRFIPKTQKMVLDATLLNTQHFKASVKGKVEHSREKSSAVFYTLV